MKASFDGIRKRLAGDFNDLVYMTHPDKQHKRLSNMRQTIVGLLCMHDPNDSDDRNDLIDEVKLLALPPQAEL